MTEINGKNITLRTMNQKEMRALWRKFEPSDGSNYVYDEAKTDLIYKRAAEKEDWNRVLGIFTKNGEVIGEITLSQIVYSEKRCSVSLFIATSAHRGKGFGTEALKLAEKYAKEQLGLTRIYADVSEGDLPMRRVMKKCAFLHTKTFARGMPDGENRMSFVCVL